MNQDVEWSQDPLSVTVRVPMKRTIKLKIVVAAYSSFLKIHHKERNYLRIIDLFANVKPESLTWDYTDHKIHITLGKEAAKLWDSFEAIGKSKLELRARRQQSIIEKEEADKQKMDDLQNLKEVMKKDAFEQKLDMDKELRHKADEIKNQEKRKALEYIHDNLETSGNHPPSRAIKLDTKHEHDIPIKVYENNINDVRTCNSLGDMIDPGKRDGLEAARDFSPLQRPMEELLSAEEAQIIKNKAINADKTTSPQLSEFQRTRVSEPIQLQFTQRVFPALAMREQHLLQAPTVKGSKISEKSDGLSYMALKEKADNFFKNHDYKSAIYAYEESLKLKPNAFHTLLNFSALYIKLMHLEKAESLLDQFESSFNSMDEIGRAVKENQRLLNNCQIKRAWVAVLKGDLESAGGLINLCQQLSNAEAIEQLLTNDLEKFEARTESQKTKCQADKLLEASNITGAIAQYEEALLADKTNIIALSNLSYACFQHSDFEKALEHINQCIDYLSSMLNYCDFKAELSNKDVPLLRFLLKAFLRKAEIQERMGLLEDAAHTVKECRRYDESNRKALAAARSLKRKKSLIEFASIKQRYIDLIHSKQFPEAVEQISKAEALLDFDLDVLDLLKNSLNKCACFLQMSRNSEIIPECIRGLKIINNLINNTIDQHKIDLVAKNKALIKELQIRFLLRRSSALARLGQPFNAKKDLEEILAIDASHEEAKSALEAFKQMVL